MSEAPTAVIAEDEAVLRAELRERLNVLWPELVICAEAGDGLSAVRACNEFAPKVLFLDIQMPGLNGLEVAQQVGGKTTVVFITAYDQHAMTAFERGAIDYVQKPISAARFAMTVARVKERLHSQPTDLRVVEKLLREVAGQGTEYPKWLTVPHGHDLRLVTTDEICYLRADNKYTSVFTPGAEYLLTSTLKEVRGKLDPRNFWQIHRSVVVNAAAIQSVHRTFRGALEIKLKERAEVLPVSAANAHLFRHL
jgi:DNA-binding LytR/AlgR family response regulator